MPQPFFAGQDSRKAKGKILKAEVVHGKASAAKALVDKTAGQAAIARGGKGKRNAAGVDFHNSPPWRVFKKGSRRKKRNQAGSLNFLRTVRARYSLISRWRGIGWHIVVRGF